MCESKRIEELEAKLELLERKVGFMEKEVYSIIPWHRSELNNVPLTPIPSIPALIQPFVTPVATNTGLVRLEDTEYIEVHAVSNRYVTREFFDILTLLIKQNFKAFPDRTFKKLYISAAGKQDGIDTIGLHGGGKAIDAHYFIFGEEPLYDIAGRVTGMFDLKREMAFVKDFIAAFPKPVIYMNDRIYFVMLVADTSGTIKDFIHPAGGHDDHIHLGYE